MTPSENKTVIFDLDNTISDSRHRSHHLKKDGKGWLAFNYASVDDTPNRDVIAKLRALKDKGFRISIVSGRSDLVRRETIDWLRANGVPYDELHLRPHNNRQPSDLYKREIVARMPSAVAVVDDEKKNLSTLGALGLKTYHVIDGKVQGSMAELHNKYLQKIQEKK